MSTPISNTTDGSNEKEPAKEDSIFLDVADMKGYDKNLKNARIYLYVIAGIQAIAAVYEYVTISDYSQKYALIAGGIDIGIGIIFVALAIWSHKKPSPAFLTALIVYITVHILAIIGDKSMIYKGVILKVLVIVALIKGFKDARDYEQMKRTLGTNAS